MVAVGRRWPSHGQVGNPSIGALTLSIARSAAEGVSEHVAVELECMDRLYVNAYVPILQSGAGTSHFFREIRANPVPSSAPMGPMTRSLVASIERFARDEGV